MSKLVLSVFPGFVVGGQQARFAAIANHFGPAWQHAIVSLNGEMACCERLDPGLDVAFPQIDLNINLAGRLQRIRRLIARLKPDVLVTHNWGAIEWAMANALRPLTAHVHIEDGFGPDERDRQNPKRGLVRRVVLRRSTVILPSQTLMELARNIWKLPAQRLHYVPNGIDLARFAPTTDMRREIPVIGTIAALREEKNLARLLHAFRLVLDQQPAKLVIVGDGPQAPTLHALADQLGLRNHVTFTGHQTNTAPFYAGFDIFALSSDTEQMPLTVLEAMATALPLAATDVGDVGRMLSKANRAFVVARDAAALAGALGKLVANRLICREIGAENRGEITARFDQMQMFSAYQSLLFPLSVG